MGKRMKRLLARVEKAVTGKCPRCGGTGTTTKITHHYIRQVPCKVCA